MGYLMAVVIMTAAALLIRRSMPSLSWEWCVAAGFGVYALLSPAVFRYARVSWMYLDWVLDPPGGR